MSELSLHSAGETAVGLCHHSLLARSHANGTESVWILSKCPRLGVLCDALNFASDDSSRVSRICRVRIYRISRQVRCPNRALQALGVFDALQKLSCNADAKEIRQWNTGKTWKLLDLGAEAVRKYGFHISLETLQFACLWLSSFRRVFRTYKQSQAIQVARRR